MSLRTLTSVLTGRAHPATNDRLPAPYVTTPGMRPGPPLLPEMRTQR